jgi:adenosylhomocysteine nucleosidase
LIALICATPWEMACMTSLMKGVAERDSPGGTRLVEGRLDDQVILLLACGIGKVPAAAGTRFLLDRYSLDALVNYGIAGSLSSRVKTGDLVIATELIHGDVGVAHSRGFKPTGPGLCEEDGVFFSPLCAVSPSLVENARAAAVGASLPYHLGKILTCDQVVLDPELRTHLGERFDALAVEMEGAAAAQVALGEDLPFIAARTISDELSCDFVGMERILPLKGQSRRHLFGKRFLLTVTNPSVMAKARELYRGRDLALANMAAFLEVFLPGLRASLP